jgi:hypothetical protein
LCGRRCGLREERDDWRWGGDQERSEVRVYIAVFIPSLWAWASIYV